jgi:uncharacterized membrane protein HdeD (DUF308 family)
MGIASTPDVEALRRRAVTTIHEHWKAFLLQGILMVVLGMLAVALPNISTLEIELLVGWLFIISGCFRVATIFKKRHLPGFWWSLFSGIIAVAVGVILVIRPLQGVISLTLVMTVFFVVEGVASVFVALDFRQHLRHWGLVLLSGLINLVLAYLIWRGWPNTATWVIGLYVGIYMIFFGVPLIMSAIVARHLATTST